MTDTNTLTHEGAVPAAEHAQERKVFMPRADIYETKDAVLVVADMPGVDEKTVDVTLEKNLLTIRGHVEQTTQEGFRNGYLEYDTGDYERVFTVGDSLDRDGIQASVKNGVLRVALPKASPAKTRKIEVRSV